MRVLIERAFASYVKKCPYRPKRDYTQKQNKELYRLTFLSNFALNNSIISSAHQYDPTEDYILLLQAGSKLNLTTTEKKILAQYRNYG